MLSLVTLLIAGVLCSVLSIVYEPKTLNTTKLSKRNKIIQLGQEVTINSHHQHLQTTNLNGQKKKINRKSSNSPTNNIRNRCGKSRK